MTVHRRSQAHHRHFSLYQANTVIGDAQTHTGEAAERLALDEAGSTAYKGAAIGEGRGGRSGRFRQNTCERDGRVNGNRFVYVWHPGTSRLRRVFARDIGES